MKVLYCASECVPFIKTGGLADVAGSLPPALRRLGVDVRVMLPKYRVIDPYWKARMEPVASFEVLFGWARMYCGVERVVIDDVTYYFIDNEEMFSSGRIYGDGFDEGLRFAFFCRAALEALSRIDFLPDVLHLNDWQTGLMAALLRTQYQSTPGCSHIKTVFSIHNLRYQGLFDWNMLNGRLGLDPRYFTPEFLEFYGSLSCMKAGLVFSDRIATVSRTYAEEIKTPGYGERLDGLLRARADDLSGIRNGIDTVIFNPADDRFLPACYTAADLAGKAENKAQLQRACGLPVLSDVPLVGLIARLADQKGLDLIECVLEQLMQLDAQYVFLGDGEKRYADMLHWAQWRYPQKLSFCAGLDEGLAHRIYAGADLFLMPSRFEPCGLSQMIALRYGTLPVVRETGGLKDTVEPYNRYTGEGNGFSFANYNAHEMLMCVERAAALYRGDPAAFKRMQARGMADDFGWDASAREYLALYADLLPPPVKPPRRRPAKKKPEA